MNEITNINMELGRILREEFIESRTSEWIEIGEELRNKRIDLGITVKEMSCMLGTSATRLRNFENGKPVILAYNLERTYKLALELYSLKHQNEPQRLFEGMHHMAQHLLGNNEKLVDLLAKSNQQNEILLDQNQQLKEMLAEYIEIAEVVH